MARLSVGARCGWQPALPLATPAARLSWRAGVPVAESLRLAWRVAERSGRSARGRWGSAAAAAVGARLAGDRGLAVAASARSGWAPQPRQASSVRTVWGPCDALALPGARMPGSPGVRDAIGARTPWGPCDALALTGMRMPWAPSLPAAVSLRTPWGRWFNPIAVGVRGPWDHEPDEPASTIVIPLRLVYRMLHTITIRPVGDTVELPCSSVTVTQDADSWAYSVDVEILGRSEWQRVAPVGGVPVECELIIDGHAFRALIESCEGTHEHARLPVGRARGRSLSARLAGEYSPARDYAEAAGWNLAQLADRELPPAGWSLDWQAADGAVPAGAWSYQGLAPIAAMARVADAAGAILVPSRTAQALTALPRWSVLPWAFAGATPDVEIPLESVLSATEALPVPGDPANAVYVVGGDVGGVLAWVKRTGSAGDLLLPSISEPLATAEPIARARGARALADQWPAPAYTGFAVPLSAPGGDWPLLELGQLVSLTGAGAPVRGIVSSVTITGRTGQRGGLVVEQQVGIGARSRNTYAAWRRLQDSRPLLPATVTAVIGGDRYTVELAIGGATIPVRSAASWTVGSTVWVQAGTIVGAAPAFGVAVELDV